jgi:hypothetical protein
LKISSDLARAAASVSLAEQRFELSASGGVHRRPAVSVPLADGSNPVVFPEAKSADATFTVLDRRSIGGLRLALSGSLTQPLGSSLPNRSRGTMVRLVASKMFAEQRGQIEFDIAGEKFKDGGNAQMCTTSQNPFACYGTSSTTAAQTGVLASWRVSREWLLIADGHLGYQSIGSTFVYPMNPVDPMSPLANNAVTWPSVFSFTAFVRAQWRYR